MHSYRHRFGYAEGDPALDGIERRLAARPAIAVPSIVLHGGDDGVDPAQRSEGDWPHFGQHYRRVVVPGIGHNLPQEWPEGFARAVIEAAGDAM